MEKNKPQEKKPEIKDPPRDPEIDETPAEFIDVSESPEREYARQRRRPNEQRTEDGKY